MEPSEVGGFENALMKCANKSGVCWRGSKFYDEDFTFQYLTKCCLFVASCVDCRICLGKK